MARLLSVCLSVFTFSNVFSSRTTRPIEIKFYMEPPWGGGMKVCIWGPGHMTKMAAMPIYGKNPSKFFSGTARPICMKLGMLHLGRGPIINCITGDPGMTLTYFRPRSNLVA